MRKRLGLLVLLLTALTWAQIATPSTALACSGECGPLTPQSELQRADVVFSGKVISVTPVSSQTPADTYAVLFDVIATWKGTSSPQLTLITANGGCSYWFDVGTSYLVYAFRSYHPVTLRLGNYHVELPLTTNWLGVTSICNLTGPLEFAEYDLAVLGPGMTPTQDAFTLLLSLLPWLLLLLALAALLLWLRRKRRRSASHTSVL